MKDSFYKNDIITACSLFVIAMLLVSGDELATAITTSNVPSNFVFHYQGLIAGLIAILAAVIGGGYINKQITQQIQERKERADAKEAVFATASLEYADDAKYFFDRIGELATQMRHVAAFRIGDDIVNLKPKGIPTIFDSWEFYAELPTKSVNAALDIRSAVGIIDMALEKVGPVIEHTDYQTFRDVFDEAYADIEKNCEKLES